MKKKIIRNLMVGIVMLAISIFLITTSKAAFTISMDLSAKENVKVGEEVVVTMGLSENVVACNFEVVYNQSVFEFISSETNGLKAAVNGAKVSCVYFDIEQNGTKTLKLKFKAKKETNAETNFSISGAKFREKGKEESYTGSEIVGADKILTVKSVTNTTTTPGKEIETNTGEQEKGSITEKETGSKSTPKAVAVTDDKNTIRGTTKTTTIPTTKSTATKSIPKAGAKENIGYVTMIASLILIISTIFKAKEMRLSKEFKSFGIKK